MSVEKGEKKRDRPAAGETIKQKQVTRRDHWTVLQEFYF